MSSFKMVVSVTLIANSKARNEIFRHKGIPRFLPKGKICQALASFLIYVRPVQILFSSIFATTGRPALSLYVFSSWDKVKHWSGDYICLLFKRWFTTWFSTSGRILGVSQWPYPNGVVEVAVNHQGPAKLRADCHRYFSNTTSVCVWIAGRKFWVGWADRAANGNRAMTDMRFLPHHHPIDTPVDLVYNIPMQTVYGNGIAIPPNSPATLDIDIDCDPLIHDLIREKFSKPMTW
jgi:hypothetical protein